MSSISKNTEVEIRLDGVKYNAPIDWQDINIVAEYDEDISQPNLTIENFTFTLEAKEAVKNWFFNGGAFEGMPFDLTIFNNDSDTKTFSSFLDFTNGYKDFLDDGTLEVNTINDKSIQQFLEQASGITFGYLESVGLVKSSDYVDVDYVVEKRFNLVEIIISAITIYLLSKELYESAKRTGETIATATGIFSAGFTGSVGSAIYLVAIAIVNAIYTAIMLLTIIELAKTLFEALLPPKRTHKAIKLKRALEIVANKFDYNLIAPISELDNIVYLPSNPDFDEKTAFGFISVTKGVQKGIPDVLDFGYNCREMFQIATDIFRAGISVIGNDIHLRPLNDPFWIKTSTWNYNNKSPKLLVKEYNTDEVRGNKLLSFRTDLKDDYTIDNYKGTSYEIRTEQSTSVRPRAELIKGLTEFDFRCALGNRKDKLNGLENILKSVAQLIDNVTGILGGGTNFAKIVKSRLGVLKQSDNNHSVPKFLYMSNGSIPSNHRELWSAKVLYDKYHKYDSFVLDGYFNQKTVYNNVRIPFGFEDYKILTNNPYFDFDGSTAKIVKFDWTIGQDEAVISFWVREPYTKNLKETYIEP